MEINCEWTQERLSLLIDGEVGAGEAGRIAAHLSGCSSCREEEAALRLLAAEVRSLPRLAPPRDLPDRIRAAVVRSAVAPQPASPGGWGRLKERLTLAASVLLLVALVPILLTIGSNGPGGTTPEDSLVRNDVSKRGLDDGQGAGPRATDRLRQVEAVSARETRRRLDDLRNELGRALEEKVEKLAGLKSRMDRAEARRVMERIEKARMKHLALRPGDDLKRPSEGQSKTLPPPSAPSRRQEGSGRQGLAGPDLRRGRRGATKWKKWAEGKLALPLPGKRPGSRSGKGGREPLAAPRVAVAKASPASPARPDFTRKRAERGSAYRLSFRAAAGSSTAPGRVGGGGAVPSEKSSVRRGAPPSDPLYSKADPVPSIPVHRIVIRASDVEGAFGKVFTSLPQGVSFRVQVRRESRRILLRLDAAGVAQLAMVLRTRLGRDELLAHTMPALLPRSTGRKVLLGVSTGGLQDPDEGAGEKRRDAVRPGQFESGRRKGSRAEERGLDEERTGRSGGPSRIDTKGKDGTPGSKPRPGLDPRSRRGDSDVRSEVDKSRHHHERPSPSTRSAAGKKDQGEGAGPGAGLKRGTVRLKERHARTDKEKKEESSRSVSSMTGGTARQEVRKEAVGEKSPARPEGADVREGQTTARSGTIRKPPRTVLLEIVIHKGS